MRPIFDTLAKMAVTTVTNQMGEPAIWLSVNDAAMTGDVLFKDPSEASPIGDSESYDYRPTTATAEYHTDTFPGLKEAVDGEATEYLIIRNREYLVLSITTKFDGKMCIANLEPHDPDG